MCVSDRRWKPPELAGHLWLEQEFDQAAYDFDQGLYVPWTSEEAGTRHGAREGESDEAAMERARR